MFVISFAGLGDEVVLLDGKLEGFDDKGKGFLTIFIVSSRFQILFISIFHVVLFTVFIFPSPFQKTYLYVL